jgi:hypothetical protein
MLFEVAILAKHITFDYFGEDTFLAPAVCDRLRDISVLLLWVAVMEIKTRPKGFWTTTTLQSSLKFS